MKFAAVLALTLFASSTARAQESAKAPAAGSKSGDGFSVVAVWHAHYDYNWISNSSAAVRAENYGGCAEGTPIITSEDETGDAYVTEEVNKTTGQSRATVNSGEWSWKWKFDDQCNPKRSKQNSSAGGFGMAHVNQSSNNGKPSIHFDVATGKPTQGTRQVNFPMTCEGALTGGDITCNQDGGDSAVSGLAHINWQSHLLITRYAGPVDAVLVTPRGSAKLQPNTFGDGQNMYIFANSDPGRLIINFKAKTIPPGRAAEFKGNAKFKIDPIGNSKITWDAANPDGQASINGNFLTARLTLTGLPDKNSDFGEKTVQLLIGGNERDSARPEIFFPKFATNHPGGVRGNPNWFYYWKEGNVCGIAPKDIFDGSATSSDYYGWSDPPHDSIVRLCPLAAMKNDGPEPCNSGTKAFGSITVTGDGKGIKCVAETMQHEGHHIAIYNMFKTQLDKAGDPDQDGVPSMEEVTLDGIDSDMRNPDTFNLGGDYISYGDNEVRCRKIELNHTIEYHPGKDWAWPGCQSVPPYGP